MASLLRDLPGEAALTKLRHLPRAEAMRIAMIRYGWDAATAAKKVDIEREEPANLFEPRLEAQNTQRDPLSPPAAKRLRREYEGF